MSLMDGIDRRSFFQQMGVIQVAEPALARAFQIQADKRWRDVDFDRSPHGQPWHVSFHASEFPGDDELACPRKALYGRLDLPNAKPIDRAGVTVMEMGNAVENVNVWAFHDAGMLLSAPPNAKNQTGFRHRDSWLTASTDAVILPQNWNKPHVVEIKSKDHDVISSMRSGSKGPDPQHVKQVKVYIGLAHLFAPFYWPHLDLPDTGSILYCSRQRPNYTCEFMFDLDEQMISSGLNKLQAWKALFEANELPARPKDWKWSEGPCEYCDVKNVHITDAEGNKVRTVGCKEDNKTGVSKLTDSTLVDFAKSMNPNYDVHKTVQAVLDFWRPK